VRRVTRLTGFALLVETLREHLANLRRCDGTLDHLHLHHGITKRTARAAHLH
jgi:hypothetical protein